MSCKEKIKSFGELKQVVKKQEDEMRKKVEYLDKKLVLVGAIYEKIAALEHTNPDILEKNLKYNGTNSIIRSFAQQDKLQVKHFICAVKKYANSNMPKIAELTGINNMLYRFVEKSKELDKKEKEKELQRLEKERKEKEKKKAVSREVYTFCNKSTSTKPIENALNRRCISTLFHFTRIENLLSIVDNGIRPKSDLGASNIPFVFNDKNRIEKMLDCSCVSIEFPNIWLLKSYMNQNPDSDWVLIKLNAELLLEQTNYYAEHNAATDSVKQNLTSKTSVEWFENMFAEKIIVQKAYGDQRQFARKNLVSYLPTSDQAEILVEGTIPSQYIEAVVFQYEDVKKRYERYLKKKKIEFIVNADLFKYHRDKFRWEER